MTSEETVLCIEKSRLPTPWTQPISVIPVDWDTYIKASEGAGYDFIKRSEAETDASRKQIIPYIVLQTTDLKQTAVYNRQGSEERLHDLWSCGIGGHINPVDRSGKTDSFQNALLAGMKRELTEELESRPEQDTPAFLGIISEDKTDVGKVHLGAVFRILTNTPERYTPGPELFQFHWKDTAELGSLNMELWSTLALELIGTQ